MKVHELARFDRFARPASEGPRFRSWSPPRWFAALGLWALVAAIVPTSASASPCGAPGQRACCLGERVPSCNEGSIEVAGCSGDCTCGGFNPFGIFGSSGTCRATTPCGGEGQRACCFLIEAAGRSCQAGLIEIPGCAGNCLCDGAGTGQSSSGICVRPTPCGGQGQRACCLVERAIDQGPCQEGLTEISGCTGDCFCGGNAVAGTTSTSACTALGPVQEPTTGFDPEPAGDQCPLRGYADLHVHLFANLAHGGTAFAGAPYHPGGIDVALAQDFAQHGDHLLGQDTLGVGTKDQNTGTLVLGLSPYGAPLFNGWPTWHSTTHQQMYYKWLERAWQGGLRLISALAVTNEAICKSEDLPPEVCEDSMASVDAQLDATWALQHFIDEQVGGAERLCTDTLNACQEHDDCGTGARCEIGGAQGWFRIVRTPQEARQVISDGKLAVVLGIEVEHLFNCRHDGCRGKEPGETDEQYVARQVEAYYDAGVRHVFPIHNFDNAFGAPATWQNVINMGNRAVTGHWWNAGDCPGEDYGFKLNAGLFNSSFDIFLFGGVFKFGNDDFPPGHAGDASCHTQGLRPLGRFLIDKLMEYGMVIDVDHMSNHALDETLSMLEAQSPEYPVVASHVQFHELNAEPIRHERMRTREQLLRIRDLGGLVAAMTKDDVADTDNRGQKRTLAYGSLDDTCRHSSVTFAQAFQYASTVMGGPVAFGSDFNGVAAHVGPRFGHDACGWDPYERAYQQQHGTRLVYPFRLPGFGTFEKQVTGERTFDFNIDGLAHVGMLPDLIADMRTIGVSSQELEPLFQSAEAYVALWERAENATAPDARPSCSALDVTVAADANCRGAADVLDPAIDDGTIEASQAPAGPYPLGKTSVRLSVMPEGSCAGPVTCNGSVTVVDQTPPAITCPEDVLAECTEHVATPSELPTPTLGADNCGAARSDGCTPTVGTAFALGVHPVACSARDTSDNVATCNFDVRVQDTLAPQLTAPVDIGPVECTSPQGALVELGVPEASDRCDVVPVVTHDAPEYLPPRTTTSVTWTAMDTTGNVTQDVQQVGVVDTTPPAISCPADLVAECTGSGKADVSLADAEASDICGGVVLTHDGPEEYTLGDHNVTQTAADDGGLSASCAHTVAVVDTTPPEINCPDPAVIECTGNHSAPFAPVAPEVFDLCAQNGGPALTVVTPPAASFPLGMTQLSYSVTDVSQLTAQCVSSVTVVDTTPPVIESMAASPDELWPPNHNMVDVALTVVASDRCDPTPPVCTLFAIDSDEPQNGRGEGNTEVDTEITGPLSARVRAERSGGQDGRVYTLHVRCVDRAGNPTEASTEVRVRHDQGT